MKTHLKIKIKSLAAEARIIRAEEHKWPGAHPMRHSLRQHRITDVRDEARAAGLAYGYLRERSYETMEMFADHEPDWDRVFAIAKKFGSPAKVVDGITRVRGTEEQAKAQKFAEWLDEAKLYYETQTKARAKMRAMHPPVVKGPRPPHRTMAEWNAIKATFR